MIDATRKMYKDIMSSDEYAHSPFEALYENFLIDSIVTLYTYSQKEAASNLYQELRTEIKNANSLVMTLDQFVLNEWEDDIKSGDFKQIANELEGLIFTSCILIGYGDREAAADHLALARRVYDSYARQHEDLDRVTLPPFSEMKARTARAIIENYPPEIANRIRAELEEDLQKQEQSAADAGGSGADKEAAGQ